MPCCGRANNRIQKAGNAGHHGRYAYRSSSQIAQLEKIGASRCNTCNAFTVGDPCSVCGQSKAQKEEQEKGEG